MTTHLIIEPLRHEKCKRVATHFGWQHGALVVLCLWAYGGTGSGAAITDFIDPVNSAMANLGGGYALTTVDLTE